MGSMNVNGKGNVMASAVKVDYAALFAEADAAGCVAAAALVPAAMVVSSVDVFDRPIPGAPVYVVADGVCGFAWVKVRPANSGLAKWLKKFKGARVGYYGGMEFWIRGYNQSMQRKEAYAQAFAKVLSDAGYQAYAESKLD
jgi:hypothetical protein